MRILLLQNYNVKSVNNPTYVMNLKRNKIKLSNIEMYIDNQRVFPYIVYEYPYKIYHEEVFVSYKFKKLGINNIKIIINQTLTKMQNLFYKCSDLVDIAFSESFDTSIVQNLDSMFASCDSLTKVDLSPFNTSSVNDYTFMFIYADKITSLDLSNFEAKYSCGFNQMFSSAESLKYIDISSFYSIYPGCNSLDLYNAPDNGQVIANTKLNGIWTKNWKIIYKNWLKNSLNLINKI